MSILTRLFSRWSRRGRVVRERAQRRDQIMPLVERAVTQSGLIKPEFIPRLTDMMVDAGDGRVEGAALYYRKHGTQLSDAAKKALGLRRNTFFTHEVESMLTDEGRSNPLGALPTTLLRVSFALSAQRDITNARAAGITHYKWRTSRDASTCRVCKRREGRLFSYPVELDDLDAFPGSCTDCVDGPCRCYAEAVLPAD